MFGNKKSTVTVNGQTFTGNNVEVRGNKVIIDGKEFKDEEAKEINIVVQGSVHLLDVDNCSTIEISGNAGKVETMSGDVTVNGDINGSVSTMSGDIECKNVEGSVSSMSGNVRLK